jgi:hypothetical protein
VVGVFQIVWPGTGRVYIFNNSPSPLQGHFLFSVRKKTLKFLFVAGLVMQVVIEYLYTGVDNVGFRDFFWGYSR